MELGAWSPCPLEPCCAAHSTPVGGGKRMNLAATTLPKFNEPQRTRSSRRKLILIAFPSWPLVTLVVLCSLPGRSTLGYIIRLTFGGRANMDRRTFLSHSGRMLLAAGLAPRMFAENRMSESNQRRPLSFSNDWIESVLVTAVREMPVEDAIVVNLSSTAMHYRVGGDDGTILPWKSTILRHCTIESGVMVALLHVRQRTNIGGVALGWEWYGHRNPQFPRGTPLSIPLQPHIGDAPLARVP